MAHRQQRKADYFLKSGKFDESISCHQKAADLLKEALQQTVSAKATESLQLQLDHHIRQQIVVRHRQNVYETLMKVKASVANQTNASATITETRIESPRSMKVGIETAIYRTMAENDSLLQVLLCHPLNSSDSTIENTNGDSNNQIDGSQSGIKMPKDDKMIIEELRINNCELRKLVQQLIVEVEQATQCFERMQHENDQLHKVIEDLQRTNPCSRIKHLPPETTLGSSSPYVFSPVTELTPSDSMRELPALPPLDLPTFDFGVWKSESTTHP